MDSTVPRSARHRRSMLFWVTVAALLALAGGIVVLLYPVLASPVGADDRYWYLLVPGETGGSYFEAISRTLGDIVAGAENGRIVALTTLLRQLTSLAVTGIAVATSSPIFAVQAGMKLILIALVVLTCSAFLRSLRWRAAQGSLMSLSRPTIVVITVTTAAFLAIGAQAQDQFANGWTTYAPLTYTAVIVILGSASLLVWLTRKAASGPSGWKVVGIGSAAVIGLALNFSYELFYVAVPVVVLTLLLQPVHVDARRGVKAKLIVGGAFITVFTAVFVVSRVWIANLCSTRSCYGGTQTDLNGKVATTFLRNLATAVPGGGRNELHADLARLGWEDRMPGLLAPIPLLVAGSVAAGLLFVWWRLVGSGRISDGQDGSQGDTRRESRLLLTAATIPFVAALGTALVMALSINAHELITSIGTPYRNTMATWSLLALTGAMLVRAATLRWTSRQSIALLVGVAVAIIAVGGYTLTANLSALQANRAYKPNVVTDTIQWEVVLGDPSVAGDERRCATLDELTHFNGSATWVKVARGADESFKLYHGTPYCSSGIPDLGQG